MILNLAKEKSVSSLGYKLLGILLLLVTTGFRAKQLATHTQAFGTWQV